MPRPVTVTGDTKAKDRKFEKTPEQKLTEINFDFDALSTWYLFTPEFKWSDVATFNPGSYKEKTKSRKQKELLELANAVTDFTRIKHRNIIYLLELAIIDSNRGLFSRIEKSPRLKEMLEEYGASPDDQQRSPLKQIEELFFPVVKLTTPPPKLQTPSLTTTPSTSPTTSLSPTSSTSSTSKQTSENKLTIKGIIKKVSSLTQKHPLPTNAQETHSNVQSDLKQVIVKDSDFILFKQNEIKTLTGIIAQPDLQQLRPAQWNETATELIGVAAKTDSLKDIVNCNKQLLILLEIAILDKNEDIFKKLEKNSYLSSYLETFYKDAASLQTIKNAIFLDKKLVTTSTTEKNQSSTTNTSTPKKSTEVLKKVTSPTSKSTGTPPRSVASPTGKSTGTPPRSVISPTRNVTSPTSKSTGTSPRNVISPTRNVTSPTSKSTGGTPKSETSTTTKKKEASLTGVKKSALVKTSTSTKNTVDLHEPTMVFSDDEEEPKLTKKTAVQQVHVYLATGFPQSVKANILKNKMEWNPALKKLLGTFASTDQEMYTITMGFKQMEKMPSVVATDILVAMVEQAVLLMDKELFNKICNAYQTAINSHLKVIMLNCPPDPVQALRDLFFKS